MQDRFGKSYNLYMETLLNPDNNAPVPGLRTSVEIMPVQHEGKPMFLLRDTEALTDRHAILSADSMMIAALLNGKNTVADIIAAVAKHTGVFLPRAEIVGLVKQLKEALFLETPETREKRREILNNFMASPVRKTLHADTSYPGNMPELSGFLAGFFKDSKGPLKEPVGKPAYPEAPLGLVSPHIDFARGGPVYAWSYQALSEYAAPDLIIALGTAHMSPNSPWAITAKSYETPCGPVIADNEVFSEIKDVLWYDPRDDEWVHRTEHSLEFQAVWLKYLWREKTPKWIPILCSGFERFCPDRPPSTVQTVETAIDKIGGILRSKAENGMKIMVLAGVDLAHVGPKFGNENPDPETAKRVEAEDRSSLEHAANLDADRFYMSVVSDGDKRNVCGLSALYTAVRWIKILGGKKPAAGRLLSYVQAPDPMGGFVSFASMIFPRR